MVRLADLDPHEAKHLLELECEPFESKPWSEGPALARRRVSLVSTAGLHRRGDSPFSPGAADYRVIPESLPASELIMSHVSTNYDRTGFMQDLNVVFPLERLKELVAEGFLGSVGGYHYSFMGATLPQMMEPGAREVAGQLKADGVDSVLLVPV